MALIKLKQFSTETLPGRIKQIKARDELEAKIQGFLTKKGWKNFNWCSSCGRDVRREVGFILCGRPPRYKGSYEDYRESIVYQIRDKKLIKTLGYEFRERYNRYYSQFAKKYL